MLQLRLGGPAVRIPLLLLTIPPALLAMACGGRTHSAATRPEPQRHSYTEADVRFMSHMIEHHGQALVMASLVPSRSASPAIRTLAERIASGQQDEIALMERWLQDRRQPVPASDEGHHSPPDSAGHGAGHGPAHQGHAAVMPGMLTAAQLAELERARGREFDRLFLRYMIQHHQGALTMVDRLFATPGGAREEPTFKLANDISADQSSEIRRMESMLDELSGGDGAP